MNDENGSNEIEPKRFPIGRLVAIAFFVIVGVGVQTRDLLNDRSISNIISLIAAAIVTVVLLSLGYQFLARRIGRLVSAAITLVIVMLPLSLVRLRGFSGEMVPIVEPRFPIAPQLQTDVAGLEPQVDDAVVAATPFAQFLGANRNGIIEPREFGIPNRGRDVREVWRIAVGEGWGGIAIVDDYCVTLEQRQDRECVTCYALAGGGLRWLHEDTARHQNPLGGIGPRSTPTINDGLVYTQGATGIVNCLQLDTGELVWSKSLLELGGWLQPESEASITWGRAASPLVAEGLCIVPFGRPLETSPTAEALDGRSLVAFDSKTGDLRWTVGEDQISYASPVIMSLGGQAQLVSVNESTVTGHEIASGKLLWSLPWPGQSNGGANCASALPVGDSAFLIGKGYGTGSGVFDVKRQDDTWSVEERWTSPRVMKTKFTHACIDGDVAFGLSDGTLECIDLDTGEPMWSQSRSTRYGHGQMLRVGDCLVIQAEAGEVAIVETSRESFNVFATIKGLGDKSWNIPSVAGRFFSIRNDAEAVLYELPLP